MEEVWKDIKGYEGLYQVSNLGNIKSLRSGKNLIPIRCKKGRQQYEKVKLSKFYKQTTFYVHRLVAINFLDNKNNLTHVNHKDENILNNCVDNLEWCTNKYNINYGNAQKKKGKQQIRYKVVQKDEMGNIIKVWECASEVAKTLNLNKGTIRKSCQKNLKNYGYYWEYISANL